MGLTGAGAGAPGCRVAPGLSWDAPRRLFDPWVELGCTSTGGGREVVGGGASSEVSRAPKKPPKNNQQRPWSARGWRCPGHAWQDGAPKGRRAGRRCGGGALWGRGPPIRGCQSRKLVRVGFDPPVPARERGLVELGTRGGGGLVRLGIHSVGVGRRMRRPTAPSSHPCSRQR